MPAKPPTTFLDTEGVEWRLQVHVPLIKSIKEELGYLLTDLVDSKSDLFTEIATKGNPIVLVDMLWLACREQALKREVNEEQFAMALGEGVLEQAFKALLEAIVNFSRPSGSQTLMNLYDKMEEINQKNTGLLQEAIELGVMERMAEDNSPETRKLRKMVEEARLTCGSKSSSSAASSD